jgi:lysophospholipase L1-like esterase
MRVVMLVLLLLASPAWALRGKEIACLGDSNTAAGWPTAETVRWCEYVASVCPQATLRGRRPRPVTWFNFGIGGAVVAPGPYIDYELAQARAAGADFVILAFGTNDADFGASPAEYAANVRLACRRARRRCWVMTMPPHPTLDAAAYNAAVAAVIRPKWLIDRTTGITFVDDGIHLDDASQQLLAARVAVALGCQ